jgi:hypothetical protein
VVGFGFLRFEPLLDYPFMAKAHQQKGCPAVASIVMQTPYLSLLVTLRVKMTRFARARHSRCVQNHGANETLLGLTCRFAQTWLLGFEFPSTFMDMIQSYIHARSVLPIVYICTLGACQQISADACSERMGRRTLRAYGPASR